MSSSRGDLEAAFALDPGAAPPEPAAFPIEPIAGRAAPPARPDAAARIIAADAPASAETFDAGARAIAAGTVWVGEAAPIGDAGTSGDGGASDVTDGRLA